VDKATRDLVRSRANGRCEYCLLRQEHVSLTHHIEHIQSKQHHGSDDPDNLALACHECNHHKGPNLSGVDPETGQIVTLFNPRRDDWGKHFLFVGPMIVGVTPIGRATASTLDLNGPRQLETRAELLALGDLH
jgi:hypothetical protein